MLKSLEAVNNLGPDGLDAARTRLRPTQTVVKTLLDMQSNPRAQSTHESERIYKWGLGSDDGSTDRQIDKSPCQRFACDAPAILSHLQTFGYAVVRAVADERDLETGEALLWQLLGNAAPCIQLCIAAGSSV